MSKNQILFLQLPVSSEPMLQSNKANEVGPLSTKMQTTIKKIESNHTCTIFCFFLNFINHLEHKTINVIIDEGYTFNENKIWLEKGKKDSKARRHNLVFSRKASNCWELTNHEDKMRNEDTINYGRSCYKQSSSN